MNDQNNNWEEDRLAELLRTAQHAAIPPDEPFLRAAARRIDRGLSIFLCASRKRKSTMLMFTWRISAAAAAALVVAATWLVASNSGGSGVTLSKVMEKTESAASLHVQIDAPGGRPAQGSEDDGGLDRPGRQGPRESPRRHLRDRPRPAALASRRKGQSGQPGRVALLSGPDEIARSPAAAGARCGQNGQEPPARRRPVRSARRLKAKHTTCIAIKRPMAAGSWRSRPASIRLRNSSAR